MTNITKEQFNNVYNKYPPNKWILFAYKHFSNKTEMEKLSLKKSIFYLLLLLFSCGFLGTVFNLSRLFISIFTYLFGIILLLLCFYITSAVILNNRRLNKIKNKLGITRFEYNILINKFL